MLECKTNLDKLISGGIGVCVDANIEWFNSFDEYEVSEKLDKKVMDIINHPLRYKNGHRSIKRTILLIAVIFTLLAASLMSVGAIRDKLTDIFTVWYNDIVEVFVDKGETIPTKLNFDEFIKKDSQYLTQTFSKKNVMNDTLGSYFVQYTDENNNSVFYEQGWYLNDGYVYKNDNCQTTEVFINELDGLVVEYPDGNVYIFWYDDTYCYRLYGDFNKDALIKFAQSFN